MKTIQQDTGEDERNARGSRLMWQITALLLPIAVVALMLMGAAFVKGKLAMNHDVNNSYRAGDIAVFVAMPLLHVAVK